MFVPIDTKEIPLQPPDSKIATGDWRILSRFWHPVAMLPELSSAKPFRAKLLDVDLVVYLSATGVAVALDRCPHRWVRLSAGEMVDGNIVCRFHGLAFSGEGQCVRVPALGRDAKLPPSYRLRTFRSEIRYGMVWVCLDDASEEPIPTYQCFDGYDESALNFTQALEWPVSAARQIESVIGWAHLSRVHGATHSGDPARSMEAALNYSIRMPFGVDCSPGSEAGGGVRSANVASPLSHDRARVFQIFTRGDPGDLFEEGPIVSEATEITALFTKHDTDVFEHIRMMEMPLNEHLQIHLPVDDAGAAYREGLRALGLGDAKVGERV